jgi:hypothetical protein
VARPQERKFLGFSFTAGPDIKRTIAPKSLERFKWRIRDITRGAKGVSVKATMEGLARYMLGWRGYRGISVERRFSVRPLRSVAATRWRACSNMMAPMLELSFLTRSKLAFGRNSFNLIGHSSKGIAFRNCVGA